jgi:hypothetical protein
MKTVVAYNKRSSPMLMNALVGRMVLKVLGGLVMVTSLAGFSQPAFALSAMPTTGVCGFIISPQYPFATLLTSPGNGWGVSIMGTINLSTKTIHMNVAALDPSTTMATQTQVSSSVVYTGPTAGPFLPFHTITTPEFIVNVLSVRNGNTLLLQMFNTTLGHQDGGLVGECNF